MGADMNPPSKYEGLRNIGYNMCMVLDTGKFVFESQFITKCNRCYLKKCDGHFNAKCDKRSLQNASLIKNILLDNYKSSKV